MAGKQYIVWTPSGPIYVNEIRGNQAILGGVYLNEEAAAVAALVKTEASDTLAAAALAHDVGALAKTEASDTLTATGTSVDGAVTVVTEASDTLSATGVTGAAKPAFVEPSVNHVGPHGRPGKFPQQLPPIDSFVESEQAPQLTKTVGDVGAASRSVQPSARSQVSCLMIMSTVARSVKTRRSRCELRLHVRARSGSTQASTSSFGLTKCAVDVVIKSSLAVEPSPTYDDDDICYDQDLLADLEIA